MDTHRISVRAVPVDQTKLLMWSTVALIVVGECVAAADLVNLLHDSTEAKWTVVVAMLALPVCGLLLIRLIVWLNEKTDERYLVLVGKRGIVKRSVARCGRPTTRIRWQDVRKVECFGAAIRITARFKCIQLFRCHVDAVAWQQIRDALQVHLDGWFEFVEATPREERMERLRQRSLLHVVLRWIAVILIPSGLALGWGWLAFQLVDTDSSLAKNLLLALFLLLLTILFAVSAWEVLRYPAALKRKPTSS